MARSEARIKVRIWDDDDFLALDGPEKLVYLFVISQPDIGHTGVLPLRIRRWAKKLKFSIGQLEKVLANLEDARFIVVDYDEEELFVRSFLRNDEVYKQPKVLLAALRQLAEIASKAIRGELAFEIQRVLDEGLPGENTRPTLLKMLGTLGRAFTSEAKPQVNTLSDTHSDTPSNGYGEGFPEGYAVPNAMGTGVGVGVGEGFEVVSSSSSSPSGEAQESSSNERPASDGTGTSKETAKPKSDQKRGTRIPLPFVVTDDMEDWAKRKAPLAHAELEYQTEQFVDYWKARTGQISFKLDWPATWMSWMRKANKDLAERAERRGETPNRHLTTTEERCPKHKRQPLTNCQICDSEKRGAA